MRNLLEEVRACRLCAEFLPHQPRPVVRLGEHAKLLIIGQAPGRKVHVSGLPWDDPSGDRLRQWLGLAKDEFYDSRAVAMVPMGFCYPGKGKSGDLPPRPECAPNWHARLLAKLPSTQLTLLVGRYAQQYYLGDNGALVADLIRQTDWQRADVLPLVHPSPRNRHWLNTHPWFEQTVVPILRARIAQLMGC